MMMRFLFILVLGVYVTSCSTLEQRSLYNWSGYDDAVYDYTKVTDENSLERLLTVYERLIQRPGGLRNVPPPGVCADYGYLLIKKGQSEKGTLLLMKEIELYPESKPFIDRILKRVNR
ncbi:MAG: DUF4810 domain-containing protein [Phocaeicola sp.]